MQAGSAPAGRACGLHLRLHLRLAAPPAAARPHSALLPPPCAPVPLCSPRCSPCSRWTRRACRAWRTRPAPCWPRWGVQASVGGPHAARRPPQGHAGLSPTALPSPLPTRAPAPPPAAYLGHPAQERRVWRSAAACHRADPGCGRGGRGGHTRSCCARCVCLPLSCRRLTLLAHSRPPLACPNLPAASRPPRAGGSCAAPVADKLSGNASSIGCQRLVDMVAEAAKVGRGGCAGRQGHSHRLVRLFSLEGGAQHPPIAPRSSLPRTLPHSTARRLRSRPTRALPLPMPLPASPLWSPPCAAASAPPRSCALPLPPPPALRCRRSAPRPHRCPRPAPRPALLPPPARPRCRPRLAQAQAAAEAFPRPPCLQPPSCIAHARFPGRSGGGNHRHCVRGLPPPGPGYVRGHHSPDV